MPPLTPAFESRHSRVTLHQLRHRLSPQAAMNDACVAYHCFVHSVLQSLSLLVYLCRIYSHNRFSFHSYLQSTLLLSFTKVTISVLLPSRALLTFTSLPSLSSLPVYVLIPVITLGTVAPFLHAERRGRGRMKAMVLVWGR